jgi:predicted acyltransferase
LLGLFYEAYEGGIRKDHSTYSYYFVTSGLAFFMLILLMQLQHFTAGMKVINYLSLNGKNPMVAYVAGNLLLTPILQLTGIYPLWSEMNTFTALGFLKGVLFTGIVSLITVYFTKQKWFWKT